MNDISQTLRKATPLFACLSSLLLLLNMPATAEDCPDSVIESTKGSYIKNSIVGIELLAESSDGDLWPLRGRGQGTIINPYQILSALHVLLPNEQDLTKAAMGLGDLEKYYLKVSKGGSQDQWIDHSEIAEKLITDTAQTCFIDGKYFPCLETTPATSTDVGVFNIDLAIEKDRLRWSNPIGPYDRAGHLIHDGNLMLVTDDPHENLGPVCIDIDINPQYATAETFSFDNTLIADRELSEGFSGSPIVYWDKRDKEFALFVIGVISAIDTSNELDVGPAGKTSKNFFVAPVDSLLREHSLFFLDGFGEHQLFDNLISETKRVSECYQHELHQKLLSVEYSKLRAAARIDSKSLKPQLKIFKACVQNFESWDATLEKLDEVLARLEELELGEKCPSSQKAQRKKCRPFSFMLDNTTFNYKKPFGDFIQDHLTRWLTEEPVPLWPPLDLTEMPPEIDLELSHIGSIHGYFETNSQVIDAITYIHCNEGSIADIQGIESEHIELINNFGRSLAYDYCPEPGLDPNEIPVLIENHLDMLNSLQANYQGDRLLRHLLEWSLERISNNRN